MTEYVDAVICEQWELQLPDFRRDFHAARPKWERGRLEHCHDVMCGQDWVVYDIGAEHGDFTALYRTWVNGDVIPVEPMSHYWPFIRGTFEANDLPAPSFWSAALVGQECREIRAATLDTLGKIERPVWPFCSKDEGIPDGGFAHLKRNRDHDVITIDWLSSQIIPNAIVLDIEGAEWHALAGAGFTLAEHRPHVWVSVHDVADGDWPGPLKGWYGKTVDDIHALMESFDYRGEELPWFGEGEHFWYYSPR